MMDESGQTRTIQASSRKSGAFLAYLLATSAVTGALVMVVEVLGSRVIGPSFGVSLFVWTALITVTLLALALGYAAGGHLADRYPSPAVLYGLIIGAGVLVALVPWLKVPVLKLALPLGLRGGALVGSFLLFGPALFLLGCVSPYVVRIAASEWGRLGRTVGVFYAVSTAGSFVGTVSTGFFVVAYFGGLFSLRPRIDPARRHLLRRLRPTNVCGRIALACAVVDGPSDAAGSDHAGRHLGPGRRQP
jgi:MFS family permease